MVAAQSVVTAQDGLKNAEERFNEAQSKYALSHEMALRAEQLLADMDRKRVDAQATESDVRGALSEAEGMANALGAEVAALQRVISRDRDTGAQLIDTVRATAGYEAALGAALAEEGNLSSSPA